MAPDFCIALPRNRNELETPGFGEARGDPNVCLWLKAGVTLETAYHPKRT